MCQLKKATAGLHMAQWWDERLQDGSQTPLCKEIRKQIVMGGSALAPEPEEDEAEMEYVNADMEDAISINV